VNGADVFTRHLDTAPLRGRTRGLLRCPFHADRTPSLSVDLEAGVFHCFGCGEQGGFKRFAELVGEAIPAGPLATQPRTPLEEARAELLQAARRERWAQPGVNDLYFISDHIRRCHTMAECLRGAVTAAGDTAAAWNVAARAADLERDGLRIEAELEEALA
jgi:CHC2-type zinc finger protein